MQWLAEYSVTHLLRTQSPNRISFVYLVVLHDWQNATQIPSPS